VEPADVLGELQREFIAASRAMQQLAGRIERLNTAPAVVHHTINAPYGAPAPLRGAV
jgi:hypothetical protein